MYYLIKETLIPCTGDEVLSGTAPYAAVVTWNEWAEKKSSFNMGPEIDQDLDAPTVPITRAFVNYDSLTGSIAIPEMSYSPEITGCFSFALNEKGIVFIDDTGLAETIIGEVSKNKKTQMPSLERFLYDFLEQIIHGDLARLHRYERELDAIEQSLMAGVEESDMKRVHEVCDDMLDLRIYYDQLVDLGREFEENENNFFRAENVRYFHLFIARATRLYDMVTSLRDYTIQLQGLYQAQLDMRQNRIMTVLTVVTSVLMPLTLITGWYGMNFRYMPELDYRWSYPAVIGVSIAVVVVCMVYFKRKKWL